MELTIVIYILGCYTWSTFHRRPMLEAFAKNAQGVAQILVVNPPAYHLSRAVPLGRREPAQELEKISTNMYLLTPRFLVRAGRRKPNRRKLEKKIRQMLSLLEFKKAKRVAWIFRPEQIWHLGLAEEEHVLYECYDEYQLDPKTGHPIPGEKEKEMCLLEKADIVFATSQSLKAKRSRWHPQVYLVPNGADVEFWGQATSEDTAIAPQLIDLPRPIVGYPGNIRSYVDIGLMEYLAQVRPNWSLALLGEATADLPLQRLRGKSNVYFLGRQPYHQLPSFAKGFDVTIQPLVVNEYLHCSEPLTLWEHLAAGNVIVSTDLREIRKLDDVVIIARNNKEFVSSVDFALSNNNQDRIQQGIAKARERTWDSITKRAADLLMEEFAE